MKFLMVGDPTAKGLVTAAYGVLGYSTSALCKWLLDPISERDWGDAHLVNAIVDVHLDNPAFGHRFIADEHHDAGHQASETRAHNLRRAQRFRSMTT